MDADELLAVFDREGRRVGTKSRTQVHLDGDWHWLVFVWAARMNSSGRLRSLLQVRGRAGDPFANNLDAPAAGHVAASESHLQGAQREFREEVGVDLNPADLVLLDVKPLENPSGSCRRVVQHFYLCRKAVRLADVRFGEEVGGFAEVDVEELIELLEKARQSIVGLFRLSDEADYPVEKEVTQADFAAYSELIRDGFLLSMKQIQESISGRS